MRAPSRAFPTFLHAAVHVLVGRFSRTPHLGWVAAMYPLCGHALLGFVASSSESGAAAFAHGTFSCCPHNFLHATFHALPTSATLARAPACCALCPHIQCACVGTALCCLASTAVRLARCARSTDQCAVLSTVLLDGIPHNFLVLTSFGVNQPLILQPRDSSTRC